MDKILKELKVEDGHDRDAIAKIRNMPYYAQLVSGVWERDMPTMPSRKLMRMISTAAYMGMDSRAMVDQLLLRIGHNHDGFWEYFVEREGMYEPVASKFGKIVLAEIRGILGPAPYLPGFVYAPGANMADAVRASNIRLAIDLESQGRGIILEDLDTAIQFSSSKMFEWLLRRLQPHSRCLTDIINRGRIDLLPLIDAEKHLYLGCRGEEMKGHHECLQYAADNGYYFNTACLEAAIATGHSKCFSILLDAGIQPKLERVEQSLSLCKNAEIWQAWIAKQTVRVQLKDLTAAAKNTVGLSAMVAAGHTFGFERHIKYDFLDDSMMQFWCTHFHAWKIVQVIPEGKTETAPGEIRCGSFHGEIATLRQNLQHTDSEPDLDFGAQNEFVCELLKHQIVEYGGTKFRVEFKPILIPFVKNNIEQIAWETIELLLK